MYQTPITIRSALERIEKHKYVLPAIQREFVWSPEQIGHFFDSIMQGYPFGTFLFWKVEPEKSGEFKFYDFVCNYHQRDNPHCPELGLMPSQELTAVLDGQQRLTALNIALRGSLALKEHRKRWDNPEAFPCRRLYVNLLATSGDEELGNAYDFRFLSDSEAKARNEHEEKSEYWFQVGSILTLSNGPDMVDFLYNEGLTDKNNKYAFRTLHDLHRAVHEKPTIAYYEEESQDLDKVLNIFIRMNSGGTVLSYSDLLLSVAVAQWRDKDALKEIHTLVDDLNQVGDRFEFSHDTVLKAGLMLTDIGSVGFKVKNFNHDNMSILEEKWDDIRQALLLTVQLVASFGFNHKTVRAHSAILPIAYYLYKKAPGNRFLTHKSYQEEREKIRIWLVRSILKASGIWGSGLDTLLTALRSTIQEKGIEEFPLQSLYNTMARRGKSLSFEEEEIDELLEMEYKDRRVFALLSLCYPFVDLRNQFHIDHVYPKSLFKDSSLRQRGIIEEEIPIYRDLYNRLPNLQLIEGHLNTEKQAQLPSEWANNQFGPEGFKDYCARHDLGQLPDDISDFKSFYEDRRERMRERIKEVLGKDSTAGEVDALEAISSQL